MLPEKRAVWGHPAALQTLPHSLLEGYGPSMHGQQPRELLHLTFTPRLYQLVQVLNKHTATLQKAPDWMVGSPDASFVNSVHSKHWLETAGIRHWENMGGKRRSCQWKLANVNFTLQLVQKSRNTVNRRFSPLTICKQDYKGKNSYVCHGHGVFLSSLGRKRQNSKTRWNTLFTMWKCC